MCEARSLLSSNIYALGGKMDNTSLNYIISFNSCHIKIKQDNRIECDSEEWDVEGR